MTSKCICSICNCGKHHCKLRSCIFPSTGSIKNNSSEYTEKFVGHEADPVEAFKPKHPPKPEGKMDCKTIHNIDFQQHEMEKPWRHQAKPWKKSNNSVENLTSYKKDYTQKEVPPPTIIKQVNRPLSTGKFLGEPTYKTDYKKWDIVPEIIREVEPWKKPEHKMTAETTCMRDYVYRAGAPATSIVRKCPELQNEPLSDETLYRNIYVEHALPKVIKKEEQIYKYPNVPIDSLTVTKRDYTAQPGSRSKGFGPDRTPIKSSKPFDGKTTFKDDYLEWPTAKPKLHEYPKYKEPASKMDTLTCHNQAFKKLPLVPVGAIRPRPAKLFPKVFSPYTTYKTDYKPWEILCSPMKRNDTYVPSKVPFSGISSTKSDYVQFPFQECEQIRRNDTLKTSVEPFDDGTMYRNEYTHKEKVECPVPYLGTARVPLEFDRISDTGHLLYKAVPVA
ncbi:stabilizer of axonemal microtubules 1-like [Argonauta hians]